MSLLNLALVGLLAGALVPVAAAGADPDATPVPEVCGDRTIALAEDEVLEERTLYFRGSTRLGNVDAQNEAQLSGPAALALSPEAPTSSEDKVLAARPTGVVGNPASNRNPHQGYWWRTQPEPERIVCAGAKVFAGTATGQLTVQLWVDAPRGTGTPVTKSVQGSAPANEVSEFSVNFGQLDVVAWESLTVQLDSGPPGALAFYDSTARPSRLTYAVVVKAP